MQVKFPVLTRFKYEMINPIHEADILQNYNFLKNLKGGII